ncbi:MAG: methionyl-tRNA formyltransferase [Desulfobulbaceae bacterium]|nr:MAG: methionyl-tRNA formyltransferase [Desulfobulbaceae bacterium]
MAIVRKLNKISLEKDSRHTEVEATYSIIEDSDERYIQIDTYGSKNRQIEGKKSQSLRLSQEAIDQLLDIIKTNKF